MSSVSNHLQGIIIIVGHYGVGKTNLSLNLAQDALGEGRQVTLADLDIVNPYFRCSEHASEIEAMGGRMVAPVLAHTSVDVPSLSAAVMGSIEEAQKVSGMLLIIDVGGDDAGATALGRFADAIKRAPYEMIYVVNSRRNMTQTCDEALDIMREIESACGLRVSAIAGNDHLKSETDLGCIEQGYVFAKSCAEASGLPLAFVTMPDWLLKGDAARNWAQEDGKRIYPIKQIVMTPWE